MTYTVLFDLHRHGALVVKARRHRAPETERHLRHADI